MHTHYALRRPELALVFQNPLMEKNKMRTSVVEEITRKMAAHQFNMAIDRLRERKAQILWDIHTLKMEASVMFIRDRSYCVFERNSIEKVRELVQRDLNDDVPQVDRRGYHAELEIQLLKLERIREDLCKLRQELGQVNIRLADYGF